MLLFYQSLDLRIILTARTLSAAAKHTQQTCDCGRMRSCRVQVAGETRVGVSKAKGGRWREGERARQSGLRRLL